MVRNRLTSEQIATALAECLRFMAPEKGPKKISNDLVVLEEWELDSEHGVEIACDLSLRLGIEIPLKDNPLIEESGPTKRQRARKFGEVVEYLTTISQQ